MKLEELPLAVAHRLLGPVPVLLGEAQGPRQAQGHHGRDDRDGHQEFEQKIAVREGNGRCRGRALGEI